MKGFSITREDYSITRERLLNHAEGRALPHHHVGYLNTAEGCSITEGKKKSAQSPKRKLRIPTPMLISMLIPHAHSPCSFVRAKRPITLQLTRWSSGCDVRPLPRRLQVRARQVPNHRPTRREIGLGSFYSCPGPSHAETHV